MNINDTQYLNNGYPMPSIGLGVYKITDDEMNEVINTAIEAGYRAFDTAYFYGNEQSLGQAFKQTLIEKIYLLHLNYGMIIKDMTVQFNISINL